MRRVEQLVSAVDVCLLPVVLHQIAHRRTLRMPEDEPAARRLPRHHPSATKAISSTASKHAQYRGCEAPLAGSWQAPSRLLAGS